MYVFPFRHNWCLHIHSDRKNNSPPIAHFRFSNDVKGKQKYKKERWQCSQNFILNPTRVEVTGDWLSSLLDRITGMIDE